MTRFRLFFCLIVLLMAETAAHASALSPQGPETEIQERPPQKQPTRETRQIAGWQVHVSNDLWKVSPEETKRALELLQVQLDEIVRVVPAAAVTELQKVPLSFSTRYRETIPRAEYHPGAQWLRENRREPAMAKGVEFSNIEIFEAETRRMPNFALHELAHAYHDRVLTDGFQNKGLKQLHEKALASGLYNRVDRQDSEGRITKDRAYAISSTMEYFAESTEAFFSRNDFYPFNREQLKRHDPEMYELLRKLWGTD